MGTNIVTDADIILMQEEEIERYRNKIRCLEEKLRENADDKTVRIGDEITVEGDCWKVTFKLLNCIVHTGSWVKGNVELCGVTKIGDLSE